MGDVLDFVYGRLRGHFGSFTARSCGQGTKVSVRTKFIPPTPVVFFKHSRIDLKLDAEHQLLALFGGLNDFRRELGLGRNEAYRRRDDILRERIFRRT